ncbi:NAD(P)-binding protein [Periconia macrospinosa]|uniref:NAD(P)-binding protein n=1 Tax=Periconia macrospinosa TaxID=97972 RepID=A0A2V1DAM4_9PLEO|nr:NAD(P)-binding protein [Periconia macrospinosa]
MSQQPILVPTASLHGKVAIVTGSSRGIGKGIAIELAKRGCSVVINYANSKSGADEVVETIEKLGTGVRAVAIQADVSKVPEIERLFQEAKQYFGHINVVMSNSGTESFDNTEDITEAAFDHVYSLNARAQFFIGQAAWNHLEDNGRLILMSSISAGKLGIKRHALYNSSKMAVIGMVKAFATDFGARGITVNGVAPGGVLSDMFYQSCWNYIPGATADWPAEKLEQLTAKACPLGRCAVPEDIARVVAFLASDDGGWVNGEVIITSGGFV